MLKSFSLVLSLSGLLAFSLSSLARADSNEYATTPMSIATNSDWARISFQGESARLLFERLVSKNGRPFEWKGSFQIDGGGWECTRYESKPSGEKLEKPLYSCFGDFDGNGFQRRNCKGTPCDGSAS